MTREEAALFTAIANVCPKDDNHSKVEYLTFFIEGWSFDKLPPEITSYLTEYCANSGANLVQLSYEDLVAQGYITKGDGDFYKTYDDTYKMGLGKIFTFTLKDGESTDADTCTVAVKGFISESDTSGFDVELQYVDGAWKFVKYSNAWNQHQFFTPEPEIRTDPKRLISPLSETPNRNEKPNLHLILRGCRERLRFFSYFSRNFRQKA